MSLSSRDRKIVMVIVPIVLLAGYWFLLLSPKREEAAKAGAALAKQEKARDEATARASQLEGAKSSFSTDYATMVRLGKAVPSNVDMPSLIVQLDAAARGTGIEFQKVAAGEREAAAGTPPPSPSGGSGTGGNAAAGGPSAQSAQGTSVEQANNTKASGDKDAAAKSGVDATTSKTGKKGGVPVGGAAGGSGGGSAGATGTCAPGLECVPLDFEFQGSFFDLADFFHRLKRFVNVANEKVSVGGRLMTVDSFKYTTEEDSFPRLTAEVTATVYLSPKQEGETAGASPQGPSGSPSTPAGGSGGGSSPSTSPASTPPTATATR